jgi:hypothetical protein
MPLKVVPDTRPTAVSALVEDFLADCKARGRSPKTYSVSYGYPLRGILLPFCEREGISEPAALRDRADRLEAAAHRQEVAEGHAV